MAHIKDIAHRRRTLKLLPDPASPLPVGGLGREQVEALVEAASFAPFHRPHGKARAGEATAKEPWRFYMLDSAACRSLIAPLSELPTPPKKIANMLAGADALILATWLPEPFEGTGWEANDLNMEHIAAASAAVQTLLLAATEQGIENYWSSGGSLGSNDAFSLLGISETEILLGAIFLFPSPPSGVETATGKMRPMRSAPSKWSRWVEVLPS